MKNASSRDRLFFFWLFAVFLTSFSVYLATLNPAFFNDDSAETITAGFTLGLQHPPAYALSALVDRLFSLLPVGSPSFRVNVGSAFLSSLAVMLLASLLYRFLKGFLITDKFPLSSSGDSIALAAAVSASLMTAFSKTWWEKSIGAKGGIYLLGTILIFLIWPLLLDREKNSNKSFRLAFLAFFLFGAGLANHWETHILFLPLLLIFFGGNLPDQKPFPRPYWFLSPIFLLLGASPLLYLPLRSALHPPLNLGSPDTLSFFLADFFRTYTSHREAGLLSTLFQTLSGAAPWEKFSSLFHSIMDIQGKQISIHLFDEMKVPTVILALFGLAAWRRSGERRLWLVFLAPLAFLCLSLCWASWIPPGPNAGWYTDAFLLPLNWMVPFLAAAGFYWLMGLTETPWKKGLGLLSFAAIPLYLFSANYQMCDYQTKTIPYDYGVNLLKSLPANSVFFAETDEDYFSLYYLQGVEKRRPDLQMIPTFILFEPWGVKNIELQYPALGLSASTMNFPNPITRLINAASQIVKNNRGKIPIAFSSFYGAFHRYCLPEDRKYLYRKSGVVYEVCPPSFPWKKNQREMFLRTRNWDSPAAEIHPSLLGIKQVYQWSGINP